MGFHINPYDMCVYNKDINGKQCTIAGYVDDNKVSHVEQDVIYDVINKVEERFQGLTVTKGNMHTFFVMKVRYLNNRRVAINIKEYISEAVQEFGEDLYQVATQPSARWMCTLGKVREIQGKRLDTFHFVMMKLIWIAQIGRPDCATDI